MKHPPLKTTLLFLLVTLVIIVPFCIWGDAIDGWFTRQMADAAKHRGRAGLVLFGLLALDIILPVPSSLVSTCCGLVLGLLPGFLVSFMAMNVSATLGYALGRFASTYARRLIGGRDMTMLESFARGGVGWWLLLLRPVPVLAEASVLFSGVGRQPLTRVVLEVVAGNAVVSAVYAAVGAMGKSSESMLPAFIATVAVSGVCMLVARGRGHRTVVDSDISA